ERGARAEPAAAADRERRRERVRAGVVGLADLAAAVGEVGGPRGGAREGDDPGGVRAPGEEGLDDEAAEMTAGSGDGDGHAWLLVVRDGGRTAATSSMHLLFDSANP